MMTDSSETWSEADSRLYRRLAAVAVPAREEQMATLLSLLPFSRDETFRAVELGCGPGALSYALLDCFPGAAVTALDGSALMRNHAEERLKPFGRRACVTAFNLAATEWFAYLQGIDCVVSSLCVHHLSGQAKQTLFAAIHERLSPRGAFLVADLVEPQRSEARRLFAAAWDRLAEAQALAHTGSTRLYREFIETEWNYYRFPDPVDRPSPLFDQLAWLKEAGFTVVDCFWLQAGHAIYGGYKGASAKSGSGLTFEAALVSVRKAVLAVLGR